MTSVVDTQAPGPGTHALVIGVGAYDHLMGGSGALLDNPFGLGQLGSPSLSAERFANWLMREMSNDEAPLASLEVLISAPKPVRLTTPQGAEIEIEAATMANITEAVERWKVRAENHSENITILYHCGHGLEGADLILLAQDFGAPGGAPAQLWKNAYNFDSTYLGMASWKARGQFFFVDSCRVVNQSVLNYGSATSPALVASELRGQNATRVAPKVMATVREARAYAPSDGVSRFTTALIDALESNGARKNADGKWRVTATTIGEAVKTRIEIGNVDGVPFQTCEVSGQYAGGNVAVHTLAGVPRVPMRLVGVGLPSTTSLEFHRADTPALTAEGPSPWRLEAQAGMYSIHVLDGGQVVVDLPEEIVYPPIYERDLP